MEATTREANEEVETLIGEFASRVLEGKSAADLFGVDEDFVFDVVDRAYNLYLNKSYEKAEVLLRGATALDETQSYPFLLLGDVLLQRGYFADAAEVLSKAEALESESAEVAAKLGEAQVQAGQEEAAMVTLRRAMELLDDDSVHRPRTEALLNMASDRTAAQVDAKGDQS
ncbi:tetratricopeptide repeat protein [Persicimonas caeni]|uniref:Tetratricopeptide repeat protein n=1 Tax=Persicimonas caeni TaxID=2292766 RepID=A0A4Y6Q1B1_PERCE|nr:tetratricopeptide repeat protein [Persicimonas caeni]QDG54280.1 tetratricopeptide repeat protein [Persicimonas caeni]QED35501.1 tetratricopeptide repeat protein [Persicimonas caeni]